VEKITIYPRSVFPTMFQFKGCFENAIRVSQ
jgi:hypothetical protein